MIKEKFIIFLIVFISGMCSLVLEIAGGRIIAPYVGNTIFTWASVIGLVLFSLSVGYMVGGFLADKYNDRNHLSKILLLAGITTFIVPFFSGFVLLLTLHLDIILGSFIAGLILVPPSFFYGMVSPYAIKLTSEPGKEGISSGKIFSISTVGSIFGAIGAGFFLVPNIEIPLIFFLISFLMVICSWLLSFNKSKLLDAFPFLFALMFLMLNPNSTIIHQEDTAYYSINIIDGEYNNQSARLLILNNALSSGETKSGEPVFEYEKRKKLMFNFTKPKHALVLGAAAGTQVEDLKKFYSNVEVDAVEIDSRVIELGKIYFSLKDDNRTNIIIEDARRYLMRSEKKYDLVLIDAFNGYGIPVHLSSAEFIDSLKKDLNSDGIVIINIISAVEGPKSNIFTYLQSTYSSKFKSIVVIPLSDDVQKVQNIVIFATDKNISDFENKYQNIIYSKEVPKKNILKDNLNPIEIFTVR